jgi:hypothetical protein
MRKLSSNFPQDFWISFIVGIILALLITKAMTGNK